MSNKRAVIVVFVSLAIFFFLFGIVLLFFVYMYLNNTESSTNANISRYQHIEYDSKRNEGNFGLVELPRQILPDDHLQYLNKVTGNQVLISQIGNTEYECSGTCICEENTRRSSSVLSRGLLLVLSAISVPIALKISQDMFRESCKEQFSDVCDSENVVSDVSHCSEIDDLVDNFHERYEWKNQLEKQDRDLLDLYNDLRSRHGLNDEKAGSIIRDVKGANGEGEGVIDQEDKKEPDTPIIEEKEDLGMGEDLEGPADEEEEDWEEAKEETTISITEREVEEEVEVNEFECMGRCAADKRHTYNPNPENHATIQTVLNELGPSGCESLKLANRVEVPDKYLDQKSQRIIRKSASLVAEKAKKKFNWEMFREFCRVNSLGRFVTVDRFNVNVGICHGIVKNIVCRRTGRKRTGVQVFVIQENS